jgi:hypothetical protein
VNFVSEIIIDDDPNDIVEDAIDLSQLDTKSPSKSLDGDIRRRIEDMLEAKRYRQEFDNYLD